MTDIIFHLAPFSIDRRRIFSTRTSGGGNVGTNHTDQREALSVVSNNSNATHLMIRIW